MILSQNLRFALEGGGDKPDSCAWVVGATGSGKTFKYLKPNLMQMNSCYVITDPKGEIIKDSGMMLLRNGYDIRIFNISDKRHSCYYNPFMYIKTEADVVRLVDVFLNSTNKSDSGEENSDFFALAEKNYYLMLVYYIWTTMPKEKQTFKTLYELFQMCNEVETKPGQIAEATEFDKIFEELAEKEPNNPALPYYITFKKGSAKTKQSILASSWY